MKHLLPCFSLFLTSASFGQNAIEPEWPVELISIQREAFPRNPRASLCLRPIEMVDTVVLHHAETPATTTAQEINRYHLNRGTPLDPWYMVAYSYLISGPYAGYHLPASQITEGRPLDIVGAHAGASAFVPMDSEQQRLWAEGKILCGKEGGDFKVDPSMVKQGKIKANVTTIGVVMIGNYAPFSQTNPNGYSRNRPRNPTAESQEMMAKLSCQLQKKYPRIRNIKWHSYYNATSCPGSIKHFIGQIKTRARRYGCEFK